MPSKDVGLRIRVERDLRDRFLDACRHEDRPASQVLREFMRAFIISKDSDKSKRAPSAIIKPD